MKILLLDKDTDYSQRFKYYLDKKYSDVQITLCDSYEAVSALFQKEKYDVVLFDSTFDNISEDDINIIGDAAFAYFSETHEIINDKDTVFKYSGVSVLYSKICTLYEKKKNRIIKQVDSGNNSNKQTEVITFLPVHGGAGSSTMAAACAISLAEEYQVLYINLEQRPSDSIFFSGDSRKGITDIISLLKTKYSEAALHQLLKEVIQKDKKQDCENISYIKGFVNIMESTSLSAAAVSVLLNLIRTKFDFRFIIVDTDFIVSPVLERLVFESDKITFVSSGSDISDIKIAGIHRYMELIEREADEDDEMPEKYLLLNQYYGTNNELSSARDMEIIARLARYRTDSNSRITTQQIIEEVNKKKAFERFKPVTVNAEEQA